MTSMLHSFYTLLHACYDGEATIHSTDGCVKASKQTATRPCK